jgi:hypothetical protein
MMMVEALLIKAQLVRWSEAEHNSSRAAMHQRSAEQQNAKAGRSKPPQLQLD